MKQIKTKELRFRLNIADGDFKTKVNQARKFLEKGMRVKFVVKFKGRERTFVSQGANVLERIQDSLIDCGKTMTKTGLKGSQIEMIMVPK